MRHTVSALVENQSGVLSRVAGLFTRRGFNIESVAVGVTGSPEISRMTFLVDGDDATVEQLIKQVSKLPNVIEIRQLASGEHITRELAFVKVFANPEERAHILQIAEIFRARIIDVSPRTLTLEITGDFSKLDALLGMMEAYEVCEVVRAGVIAIERGEQMMSNKNCKGDF